MSNSPIYALDFDGVICDSAIETSITGWKAAQRYWPEMQKTAINNAFITAFKQVRPYLETGYEAILIMRLLYNKVAVTHLCSNYEHHIATLIAKEKLDTNSLKKIFGRVRDQWINHNEQQWLDKNPLFLGIAKKLRTLAPTQWYIVTTKQERFVQRILSSHQITLAAEHIYGMEQQMSKQKILEILYEKHHTKNIVFVEDRLPTLRNILKKPMLEPITLQLADWGYNTKEDQKAVAGTKIQLITLNEFLT